MPRPWTGPEVADMRRLAESGVCAEQIAAQLGRTKYAIHNKARELNIKLAYPSGEDFKLTTVPDYYIRAIRSLRELGFTAREISHIFSKQHRVSAGYVRRICNGEKRALTEPK